MAAAIDLIKRSFQTGSIEINRAWCGDITYVRTWEGWLYVATVIAAPLGHARPSSLRIDTSSGRTERTPTRQLR